MHSLITLQPLTADLLPAALELDRRCLGSIWSRDGYLREIDSPNSDLWVFVEEKAKGGGQRAAGEDRILALGCAWAIVDEAHITLLAVDPDYQRQGLGQAMLLALLKRAQRRGLERSTLEVRASNQVALALYQKFGFQEAGRRKKYYQDNGEDALILWRGSLQYPQFKDEVQNWETWVGDYLSRSGWQLD
jgi:[ribosomal protein S18]-alanine N-acetyltransferase